MHVSGFPLDLYWYLQIVVTALLIGVGLLQLVKSTASKYFMVDANFDSPEPALPDAASKMEGATLAGTACAVCGKLTKKQCSGCKMVKYCSEDCQRSHWNSGHKTTCNNLKLSWKADSMSSTPSRRGSTAAALVAANGTRNIVKQTKGILFPYEDFVELFNWNKPGFPPCGLLNCGNSCFANVVLQCLASTRPLVAYLLEKGHRRACRQNDWCFLCEFQIHIERASRSSQPFSPINILSRLPNIGGNLGYGKQEDAHEFLRFAIDRMQSVCLDEFGGEKALHPTSQETTLIQHIFGGHLQSEVICTKCNNISHQYENMMDLAVEIQGDAASLEECLDQFTAKERLHGDNMYKCDGCNEYVMAWKCLTIQRAPNILTIALKRFQSGRFGKLNKRITFPETLDLSPYMSEVGDGNDIYKLYAVVVHVDMLNASFFGHYICYTKDFSGAWYLIDDSKVSRVDLEEVLSQGAYMLLYSRVYVQPSCLKHDELLGKEQQPVKVVEGDPCAEKPVEGFVQIESIDDLHDVGSPTSDRNAQATFSSSGNDFASASNSMDLREDIDMADSEPTVLQDSEMSDSELTVPQHVEVFSNGNTAEIEEKYSSVGLSNKLISGAVSLNEAFKPGVHNLVSEIPTPESVVQDGNRRERNNAKDMCGSLPENCLPTQNGVSEKGETSCSVSIGALSSDEVLEEINPADPRGKLQKVGSGKGLPSSSSIAGAERKLSGRSSSGAKLKPLFSPGFLGERPSN